MKIVFFGDSITDMGRRREYDGLSDSAFSFGVGYPAFVAGELMQTPKRYEVVNRGIANDESVNLYARLKGDVWNHQPDVLSILIGVNDLWHTIDPARRSGVELSRYAKVYRNIVAETKERFPNIKIILCEPFVTYGVGTKTYFEEFKGIKAYAEEVKKIANEYGAEFLPLQKVLDEATEREGEGAFLYDGIHPTIAGAKLIADEWLKLFKTKIDK